MASTYSTNLGIELIGSGEQSGTWGTTTNNNLGTLLEQSICGYGTAAVTTGNTTTMTMPNGASGVARNMVISVTGTGGASTFLEVPASKTKLYIIFNGATGAITVKPTGFSGISVPASTKAVLYCDGTNIVDAANYFSSLTLGAALPVASGGTGLATLTANNVILGNGVASPTFVAPTTNGNILTANGTTWVSSAPATNGTVTSVAAITLGTTGTDLSSTVANGTTTPVITLNVPTASASNRGALSAADWTTFNNKGSGTITSVTGTAPVVSSGGTTPAISMAAASTSVSGYLTSTDWNTFNDKQAAGSYVTVGGALGTPSSGTLTNCTFPTLNQNTTGSSASCTGNAAGLSSTLVVASGGTGATTATAYAVQCGGTTSTGAHQSIASVGTAGQVLTSNGAGALPTFQAVAGGQLDYSLFTTAGTATWTCPTGVTKVFVIVIGGGGGATGGDASGPGGLAIGSYTVTPGTSYSYTVGAGGAGSWFGIGTSGGTSSFSSFCSATGGQSYPTVNGTGVGSSGTFSNTSLQTSSHIFIGGISSGQTTATWTAANGINPGAGSAGWPFSSSGYSGINGAVYIQYVG